MPKTKLSVKINKKSWLHAQTHTHAHTCTRACMHTHTHTHTNTHTHTCKFYTHLFTSIGLKDSNVSWKFCLFNRAHNFLWLWHFVETWPECETVWTGPGLFSLQIWLGWQKNRSTSLELLWEAAWWDCFLPHTPTWWSVSQWSALQVGILLICSFHGVCFIG